VLAAAVETRITRQYLNEACSGLGVPWVDSGVNAESGLVSISVYGPALDNPCIECNWTDRQYATLEVG
jgi:molybdopterin/thiamine biosynthesis adenylyltransferase